MKKYIFSTLMLVALFIGCSGNGDKAFYGSGTIEATEVLISSEATGRVTNMLVKEGQYIEKGSVIAVLDSDKVFLQKQQLIAGLDELRLNIKNAQRSIDVAKDNLQNTEKKYQRIKALLAENSTTQQQFDDIETAYLTAQKQYENAKTSLEILYSKKQQLELKIDLLDRQLQDFCIISPLEGIVIDKLLEEGEMAVAGMSVANIADMKKMRFKFYVPDDELLKIKIGAKVRIFAGSKNSKEFVGHVSWISPKAEFTPKNVQTKEARADLVYAVKVLIDNPEGELKIGMPADVYLD